MIKWEIQMFGDNLRVLGDIVQIVFHFLKEIDLPVLIKVKEEFKVRFNLLNFMIFLIPKQENIVL